VSEIVNREGPGIDLRVRGFRDRQNAIHLLDEGIADVAIGSGAFPVFGTATS
jgi:hypothetical protein